MAKRNIPKLTPEEVASRAETRRMLHERLAYHEANAREEEQRREAERSKP